MSSNPTLKRLEWVLTGRAENGICPECGRPTVTVRTEGWQCRDCPASGPLPEAPAWC